MRILNPWHYASLALPLILVAGCGEGERVVLVKGQVTSAGQPLRVAGREIGLGMVQLQFFRVEEGGRSAGNAVGAVADDEGHFVVYGHNGKGIPPGKYRIAVRQWDPYPQVDKLGGRFTADNSSIIREVTGSEEILIDLARPESP
jgi:hypothetical protein